VKAFKRDGSRLPPYIEHLPGKLVFDVPEDPRLIKKVVPLKFILNDGFSKPNERYMKVKIESRSASREGAILAQIKII